MTARPALFTADRLEQLAKSGGAQVNVLVTGAPDQTLTGLANDDGRAGVAADSGVAAQLAEIRDHPPVATATDDTARTKPTESPDVPIVGGADRRAGAGRMAGGGAAMTFQPVLPLLVLAALAAVIVGARVVALRRLAAAGRTRAALWRWCGLTLAALLLLVAAARPVIGADEQGTVRVAGDADPNVFLVVDRSADMGVEDLPGGRDRMAGARDDVAALLDLYPNARFAVITFTSRPSLEWPLSADDWSLRPVMSALAPEQARADPPDQTNAGAAATVLRYQLIGASQLYPRARNLVFYLGAGGNESEAPQREFELPEDAVDGGAVLGYGSSDGEPVLRAVADQIGVPYVPRDGSVPLVGSALGSGHGDRSAAARRRTGGSHRVVLGPAPGGRGPRPDRAVPGAARVPAHQARQRGRAHMSALGWWRSGPPRLRRRRRLLVFSAPVAVLMVVAILKLCSVVIAGGSAATDYVKRDAGALRGDVAMLNPLNVVEPAKAHFAAGGLAVLDGRLEDADDQFGQALAHTEFEASCPVRVNLELVRETLGDKAAGAGNVEAAVAHYLGALSMVDGAPAGCFAGNRDPDPDRRTLRDEAAAQLKAKIDAVRVAPPPPPPPQVAEPPPPRHPRRQDPHRSNRIRDCDSTGAPAIPGTAAADSARRGSGLGLDRARKVLRDHRLRSDHRIVNLPKLQFAGEDALRIPMPDGVDQVGLRRPPPARAGWRARHLANRSARPHRTTAQPPAPQSHPRRA